MKGTLAFITTWLMLVFPALAQDRNPQNGAQVMNTDEGPTAPTEAQLAKELQNPFAELIEVPIVHNFAFGAAAGNGFQYTLTLQPLIPMKLSRCWDLITRPIFTVVDSPESSIGMGRTVGSGDLITRFYFSPSKATSFIWGFGPVLGMPTASDALLGTGKWTLGPGLAVVKQTENWSIAVVVNHVWSFAGDTSRSKVSMTAIEPSVSYTWGHGWTVGLDDASTYDSDATSGSRWVQPVQLSIGKVTSFGSRPVSLGFGIIRYALAPSGSPSVGLSLTIDLLFPKE